MTRQPVEIDLVFACIGFYRRLIGERAHTARADMGEPVELACLRRRQPLNTQGAVKQETAPAIGQAVIEDAREPVEEGGIETPQARLQGQAQR